MVRASRSLSPGERTRAILALLMAQGVNCLVLDEPTNHLDLPAIEQLEQAVADFDGTLLLVSHDRRLLESVALTRIIRLDAGQVIVGPPSERSTEPLLSTSPIQVEGVKGRAWRRSRSSTPSSSSTVTR